MSLINLLQWRKYILSWVVNHFLKQENKIFTTLIFQMKLRTLDSCVFVCCLSLQDLKVYLKCLILKFGKYPVRSNRKKTNVNHLCTRTPNCNSKEFICIQCYLMQLRVILQCIPIFVFPFASMFTLQGFSSNETEKKKGRQVYLGYQ